MWHFQAGVAAGVSAGVAAGAGLAVFCAGRSMLLRLAQFFSVVRSFMIYFGSLLPNGSSMRVL
ncbi:hypothetical protein SOVF_174300 isoform B [Spinacia oleracea]|nr:hypothetical protein SOVF_174300 isoform B [Spinacia oleracea]